MFIAKTQIDREKDIISEWLRTNGFNSNFKVQTGGSQILRVRAYDRAQNVSELGIHSWTVDIVPPKIEFVSVPEVLSNKLNVKIAMRATDLESGIHEIKCWHNNLEIQCTSNLDLNNLAEGDHVFVAQAFDKVGNASDKIQTNWKLDRTAPSLSFVKAPNNFISETSTQFEYKASDAVSSVLTYECSMDDKPYQSCGVKMNLEQLREGEHKFSVKAKDQAGNISSPITHRWSVDLTPPQINLTLKPVDHFNTLDSVFRFQAVDLMSGLHQVWCGLKDQLTTCLPSEEKKYLLSPGVYEFQVMAIDKVGNKNQVSHRWEVLDKYKPAVKDFNVTRDSYNVDILFVIDNSLSMAPYQRNMAQRIDNFISKVEGLNWQIAVTSTDPRTVSDEECVFGPPCPIIDLENGDGGFAKFGNGNYILTPTTNPLEAQKLLGQSIQMGTNGSASEEGVRATYRVLQKSLDTKFPNHKKFIRGQAPLAVVLISDEDENRNQSLNRPENLFKFFRDTWGQEKKFQFHSIINLPQFNCPDYGYDFGRNYQKMSQMTQGVIGSICQPNYSNDFSAIGQDVLEQTLSIKLDCVPQDVNNDGKPDVDVDLEMGGIVPNYKLEGDTIKFEALLPIGRHKIYYSCLRPGI
jgi:hypothetical protein